jgi:hypothetical protein
MQVNAIGELRVQGLDNFHLDLDLGSLQLKQRQHIDDPGFVLDSANAHGLDSIFLRCLLIRQAFSQEAFIGQRNLDFAEGAQCRAPIGGQSLFLLN